MRRPVTGAIPVYKYKRQPENRKNIPILGLFVSDTFVYLRG